MTNRRILTCIAMIVPAVFAAGCGSDKPEMAEAIGTVVLDGQPVPGGRVMFSPLAVGDTMTAAGRSAVGLVADDGTFELMTYSPGDGVVLGKHSILYYQPEADDEEDEEDGNVFFKGKRLYVPADSQQEIFSGDNVIEIEVFDKGPKRK